MNFKAILKRPGARTRQSGRAKVPLTVEDLKPTSEKRFTVADGRLFIKALPVLLKAQKNIRWLLLDVARMMKISRLGLAGVLGISGPHLYDVVNGKKMLGMDKMREALELWLQLRGEEGVGGTAMEGGASDE